MEKRTLLAIVLSIIVIVGSYFVQSLLYPPQPVDAPAATTTEQTVQPTGAAGGTATIAVPVVAGAPVAMGETAILQTVTITTAVAKVTLSSRGGDVVSFQLLEHRDGPDPVEMIYSMGGQPHAFTLAFGGAGAAPIGENFYVNRVSDTVVEFYKDFQVPGKDGTAASQFRLTKRYEFKPNEYLFELAVTIDFGFNTPLLNANGSAYTLTFGPQIGPRFSKLSQNYEYRRFYSYADDKRKTESVTPNKDVTLKNRVTWASIAGKYFTFVAVPDATLYTIMMSAAPADGVAEGARIFISRPAITNSKSTDVFRFYLGPKTQSAMAIYNSADKNSFKSSGLNLDAVVDTSGILGPLEVVLKWMMMIFYKIIPNYGVAIILLTVLVKVLMFPLTKKGSESTLRMQTMSPKIKEIQEKYKDNQTKMNVEMADLYKKEGYNPMSGCLPMLLQIPIFFAMYNLFNNHFDLRGAMFIPGWIPDLSIPETVWNFSPFAIPLLNWSNLRVLPFVYLASQLLSGKITQTPDQQSNTQMKMMLYMMPIVFFFILYDVPSGLLLYWIMSNVLQLAQQLIINRYLADKKAAMAAAEPVIAPKRKRR
jgi:YidC/Oxa1 family membrane protein insertase